MTQLAFIFDLEGVLIDHMQRQCEITSKAFSSMGINIRITPETYQLRSEGELHITRDFLSGLYIMQRERISPQQAKENPAIIVQERRKLGENDWHMIDELVTRFDTLRTKGELVVDGQKYVVVTKEPKLQGISQMLYLANREGHKIAMVTAGKKVDAESFMEKADLLHYFNPEFLFYGEDKVRKDDMFKQVSKIFEERYGIPKGLQFVVEDSLGGISDANTNGLRSILVLSGNTSMERLRNLSPEETPSFVLKSAKDIIGVINNNVGNVGKKALKV